MASFNGKHNHSKALLLVCLLITSGKWKWQRLSSKELAWLTGLSKYSVCSLCWRLTKWNYIRRQGSRGRYYYTISNRGINFISKFVPQKLQVEANNNLYAIAKRDHIISAIL